MVIITSVQDQHCQALIVAGQVGTILAVVSAGIIMAVRVFVVRGGSRMVRIVLWSLLLLMTACWIATATQYKAVTGPPTIVHSNCRILPLVLWSLVSYGSTVAFDLALLVFILYRFRRDLSATKSHTGRRLHQNNLIYIALLTVVNIAALIVQVLGHTNCSVTFFQPITVPLSTFMTVAMGSRVFFNLREYEGRREDIMTQTYAFPSSSYTTRFFAPQRDIAVDDHDEGLYNHVVSGSGLRASAADTGLDSSRRPQ